MSIPLPIVTVLLLFVSILAYFIARLIRFIKPNEAGSSELGPDVLDECSIETYRPMQRLLNEADFEFLAKQPGYDENVARKLRAERLGIFRDYLRCLISDFNKLVDFAQLALIHSAQDRPDLARAIFQLRLRFFWTVACTELRLALAPLPLGSINTERLMDSLTAARENIEQALAPELS